MAQPLVSVIIPAYNMQAYIAETLHSVLASDYAQLEAIVVDDGSTDKTADVVLGIAASDPRVRLLQQANGGVCRARNHGISQARGEYILPVDADDLIAPWYIPRAAEVLAARSEVKAVFCQGEFFGEKTGLWHVPDFSISLLARRNMLCVTALYRRADWQRVGGYCEEMQAREDWEFWLHVLKDGGEVVRLPEVGLRYRIRKNSKRSHDRRQKSLVVKTLNARHPEFFERELGGPLRTHRSWSRALNALHRFFHPRTCIVSEAAATKEELPYLTSFVKALPTFFSQGQGTLIKDGRNVLRVLSYHGQDYFVKSFAIPNLFNRIVYGTFRKGKAQRSHEYAQWLRSHGIGSPEPVAWMSLKTLCFFSRSYYVSRPSACPFTAADLIETEGAPRRFSADDAPVLRAIARTAARLHGLSCLHADFSRGNILFSAPDAEGRVGIELVDLNRLRFRPVSLAEGLANLRERIPFSERQWQILSTAYTEARKAR